MTCGLDAAGRIVISSYPQRAKSRNSWGPIATGGFPPGVDA